MGFTNNRRPKKWGKVIQAYLDFDPDDREKITRERVQGLIDWFAPGAKKTRKKEEEQIKAKRKESKARAREIRNLPENKSQEWSYPANRNWSYTGDVDDDGKDEIKVHVRKPRTFRASQYDPERAMTKLLGLLDKGDKKTFLGALAKEMNRDLSDTRLKTSYGMAAYEGEPGQVNDDTGHINNPEFSEGCDHGALPVPGKKLSGYARKLLGERDDKELDKGLGLATVPEFQEAWAEDQKKLRKQEAEKRKEWRKLIDTATN
jgi:hypothetical protein